MTNGKSTGTSRRNLSGWVLAFALCSTAIASLQLKFRIEEEQASRFVMRAGEARYSLKQYVNTYAEILRSLQSHFISRPKLTRADFEQVTESLALEQRLPGIQAVGFSRRVDSEGRARFITLQAKKLLKEHVFDPAGRTVAVLMQDETMTVQYISPLDKNRRGLWVDQYLDPKRRAAIERARDTGQWAASGRVRLFVDPGNIDGVVVFAPLYEGGGIPATLVERREKFLGVVFLGIRLEEMLGTVVIGPGLRDDLHIRISEVDNGQKSIIRRGDDVSPMRIDAIEPIPEARTERASRELTTTMKVDLGGSLWELHATALPRFTDSADTWLPTVVALTGILLSVIFCYVFRMRELSINSRESKLNEILKSIDQVLWTWDVPGMAARYVSLGAERTYGFPLSAFYENPTLWIECIHADDSEKFQSGCRRIIEDGRGTIRFRIVRPDNETRWIHYEGYFRPGAQPNTGRIDGVTSDITAQYKLEESLRRCNRALRAIYDCEKVIASGADEHALLQGVCDVVAASGYPMVWAGLLCENGSIIPAGITGEHREYLKSLEIPLQAGVHGPATIGEALRTGRPVVANDFSKDLNLTLWREEALRRGFHSKIALPFNDGKDAIGILNVYASEPDAFDRDELELLEGLAHRIATAIQSIQHRARRLEVEAALNLRQRAIEASPNAIIITSATGPDFPVEYVNPAFEQMTGYTSREIIGNSLRVLQGEDREQPGVEQLRAFIREQRAGHVVLRNYRKDGSAFWSDIHIAPVRDESGEVRHFVANKYDITQTKMNEAELERLANHDVLTGLPNRALLRDRLDQAIAHANRSGRQVWVVIVDLDRFKVVNDSLGHKAGDMLLQTISTRLQSAVRKTDTVARLGGDEFVLVLPERTSGPESLMSSALQRIMHAVGQVIMLEGGEFSPACSMGVAVYPNDGEDAETLMARADAAMYRAKQSGRNNFQFYAAEMDSAARLRMERELRRALEREEFVLHYQPQVELATGDIVGVEALIRWLHPERGMISPSDFISLAEESGLIVPIGLWVLRKACNQHKAWHRAGHKPLRVAVNLSPRQFADSDLIKSIVGILEDTGLDSQYLEIEITESLMMRDVERTIAMLQELNAIGVKIAIDDFGTGYSSLAYLKRFPVHTLKIDRTFVSGIEPHSSDAAIVSSIISLSHSLKLKVVAEGVETHKQAAYLRECGCDEMQGFRIGKPEPAEVIERMLIRGCLAVA